MKTTGIIILTIGLILLGISFGLKRYTNEKEYNAKYSSLTGESDSERFYKLREEYLTPKYDLENYGITLILTGMTISILSFIGLDKLKTPKKKVWIALIGILAAILTNISYVGDLFLEMYRDSYPQWSDSLAIPLMGVPFVILVSLLWTGINLIGISGNFKTNVNILPFKYDNLNYWYVTILTITIAITLMTIATGYFWQVISGFLWTYFYLSIMLGRRKARINKKLILID